MNTKIIVLGVCCFMLTGCLTTLKSIKPNLINYESQQTSIVIGKVQFDNFAKIHKKLALTVKNVENKKEYLIYVDKSGFWDGVWSRMPGEPFSTPENISLYYFVNLPRGKYKVIFLAMGEWETFPRLSFEILDNSSIYYIGTLKITKSGKKKFWTAQAPAELVILDEKEEAVSEFKKIYGYTKNSVKVNLMQKK